VELDRNLYEQRGELLVMFYEYHQNSFGYFEGPKTVIVWADSAEEADRIASENRWYPACPIEGCPWSKEEDEDDAEGGRLF